jgi:hypothetical protein
MWPHLPRICHNDTLLYFIILTIHDFSNTTCKLPEDGVLTPKHIGVISILTFTLLVSAYVGI